MNSKQVAKIRFTKEGFEKLKEKQKKLMEERPDAVEHLKRAREMGDLSENGYYKASRAKLSFIDNQLMRIKYQLKHAVIVEELERQGIGIGSTVTLEREGTSVTYRIVGDLEANPSEGTISLLSPIGKAVTNKKVGENITLTTPKGEILYKITHVA